MTAPPVQSLEAHEPMTLVAGAGGHVVGVMLPLGDGERATAVVRLNRGEARRLAQRLLACADPPD